MTRKRSSRARAAMRKPKDPERSRADILAAAADEFARRGLEGARLEAIAERTRTTRAMIYYYFGDRERLYLAVLENAYRRIRAAESALDLAPLPPLAAMRTLVEFAYDYYQANPTFVALVVAENQAGGRYIRRAARMRALNLAIVDALQAVIERGASAGVFRRGIDATDVHLAISALGLFQVANRHTFGHLFGRDFADEKVIARHRRLVVDVVLGYLGASVTPLQRVRRRAL